jgi:transposase InsO family protein
MSEAPLRSSPSDRLTALQAVPNAHCERITQTLRHELFDHVLILNQAHARQLLATYQRHYNNHRPHQTRNQPPPKH